jgi:tRNA A-37 threonylcarbamoyl transferase component Bud32
VGLAVRAQLTDDRLIEVGSSNRNGGRPGPSPGPPSEPTRPGLRARGGRVCPRCRHHVDGDATQGPPERCPHDGLALVAVAELLASDGDPFLGTTVAGRFVILGRLGAGSMGTVYRARQEAVGREVAIKILRADRAFDATAKARFSREARAMSLLVSPHTVTVFDFGELPDPRGDDLTGDTSLYLAMEMLEGESLGARLKRRGRLPVEEAVNVARQALASLAEAHDKGIIHRDLKPDNLFLAGTPGGPAPREICKVLDFGIAKIVHDQGGVDALETQAGTVFGTPRYMSPEQAQGKSLDPRSDLYALGVLLYQMLVGKAPFVDDDAVVVMARHIKTIPVPPADAAPDAGIGAELSAVVMRALAKDPAERPPSAHAFIAELDRAVARRGRVDERRDRRHDGAASPPYEGLAVARDDLASPARTGGPPRMRRSRALFLVGLSAAVSTAAGLLAMTALRPPRVPPARAELAHTVAGLRLTMVEAEMAAATARAPAEPAPTADPAPTAEPASTAAPVPTAPSGKRTGRRYKRFE